MSFSSLTDFDAHKDRGFLPEKDPLQKLPAAFDKWEQCAAQLQKLLISNQTRKTLESLPPLPVDKLSTAAETERAMVLLSYLGHAYVWCTPDPAQKLPAVIGVPWEKIATELGRLPVLSYASYAIHNWRRLDSSKPIELGNIVLLQNFMAGIDEEWFILIHVDIEAKSGPALESLRLAQIAIEQNDQDALKSHLQTCRQALESINATMKRMPEHCDPYIYYRRVRPYIHGWKNNPSLPDGLLYEGVAAYGDKPQKFRGETGAQSSIVPCLDAALGIEHEDDPLKEYLLEMQDYMPTKHRELIAAYNAGPDVRSYLLEQDSIDAEIKAAFNECVSQVETFRTTHLEYASSYIEQQTESGSANPTGIGTGGTPFMKYLTKHRDESGKHLLK